MIYLIYINPFCFIINPHTPRNGFLFGDEKGPWKTEMITSILIKESQKKIGFRMTTQIYRQISIAIDRKFMRGVDLELDNNDDIPNDLMATHSTQTAIARYGRLSGLIQELSAESIDIFRHISDQWQEWYTLLLTIFN